MGANESKTKSKKSKKPSSETNKPENVIQATKPKDLTNKDYEFLSSQTGFLKSDINAIFDKFNLNNPDAKLDRNEFVRLYQELRPEPSDILDEISEHVFRCFDTDNNGSITFQEFLIAYSLTSRG